MREIKKSIKVLEKVFENENELKELKEEFFRFKENFENSFNELEYVKNKKSQMKISEQLGDICDDFLEEMEKIMEKS